MKSLAWNCRGVNSENSTTMPYIRWLVRKTNPDFVFLSETKCSASLLFSSFSRMGCKGHAGVDAVNLSGGLFVAWFSTSMSVKSKHQGPLVILGDFNQVEFADQKSGGTRYIPGAKKFTEWRCLIMGLSLEASPKKTRRRRPYKIEAWCLDDPQIKEIIHQIWTEKEVGSPMFKNMRRQEAAAKACKTWCLERKKQLGITWDTFIEELSPLQTGIKEGKWRDEETRKRKECIEKAKYNTCIRNKGQKFVGIS
ncbi:Gamma-glutamyl phosphate reductase [Bienertia sinuspersici]